jgi:hypothetical protein
MKDSVKKMYENITPPVTSNERFADTIIERSERRSFRRAWWNSPAVAAGFAAAFVAATGLFMVNGGFMDNTPPPAQIATAAPVVYCCDFSATNPNGTCDCWDLPSSELPSYCCDELAALGGYDYATCGCDGQWSSDFNYVYVAPAPSDLVYEFYFEPTTSVLLNNEFVHGGTADHEWFIPVKLTVSQTGMTIDYIPTTVPWDETGEIAKGRLIYGNDQVWGISFIIGDDSEFPFADDVRGYVMDNKSTRSDWRFDVPLGFSAESCGKTYTQGMALRDTVTFDRPFDIENLSKINLGSERILIGDNRRQTMTTKAVPDNLSELEKQLFGIIESINRYGITFSRDNNLIDDRKNVRVGQMILWEYMIGKSLSAADAFAEGLIEEEHLQYYRNEQGELTFDTQFYRVSDMRKAYDELFSKNAANVRFDPTAGVGMLISGEIFNLAAHGLTHASTLLVVGNRTNADGTITLTTVYTSCDAGDDHLATYTVAADGNSATQNNVGYRCVFSGNVYYSPDLIKNEPRIEYTFVLEDGKHKILSIKEVN